MDVFGLLLLLLLYLEPIFPACAVLGETAVLVGGTSVLVLGRVELLEY
jgi:hypothetical protein